MLRSMRLWMLLGLAVTAAVVVARSDQRTQLIVAAIIGACALAWIRHRFRRPRIRDWQDAEVATARWLRRAGCRRVSLTGGSADGGIDVITAAWAIQVKHTSKRVGRPAVQQLVGAALSLDRAPALFSTSGFSAPAVEYATDHHVALFELDLDGSAHGINRSARRVGKRSRRLIR